MSGEQKGYEVEDVNPRGVEWAVCGLLLGGAVMFLGLGWVFFSKRPILKERFRQRLLWDLFLNARVRLPRFFNGILLLS